jgi:nitrite reductase/ring-hydroxylating ferredoxin subunit
MVRVGDREVALWRVGGIVYAIDNICPHQHTPAMHAAMLEGIYVTCRMHGWTFSLENGLEKSGNGRIRIYGVHVEGDVICIEEPKASW